MTMVNAKKQIFRPSRGVIYTGLLALGFILSAIVDAHARSNSDWNEFEDCHACAFDMTMFCQRFRPATDAVLDCLNSHWGALSTACWKDLDFFARKFPKSRWSRFAGKFHYAIPDEPYAPPPSTDILPQP